MSKLCLVTGVGPGTGTSVVKRFAIAGYKVAMLSRSEERLLNLQAEIPNTVAYPCDVSNEQQMSDVINKVKNDLGVPDVLVHNAVKGGRGNFLEIKPKDLLKNFEVNTMGLLYLARGFAQEMIDRGNGSIIVTGNTSARRGKPWFATTAPTKAAQRILAESIAREIGPKGIHVSYILIDAAIDVPWTREAWPEKPDDFFMKPDSIADEIFHITNQDKSAWTFDVEIRPFAEPW
jgi:NAD(P)-dependent dehydrogenase (short-subunit alcohol dehydrogenase family)|tara:strand:+ start:1957 stop:2655 length:699 start_codon:yes stop_codon:yes gene_type:complete